MLGFSCVIAMQADDVLEYEMTSQCYYQQCETLCIKNNFIIKLHFIKKTAQIMLRHKRR